MASDALRTILDKLVGIEDELPAFASQLMNDESTISLITDMNAQQLYEGKRSDDSEITPEYKPYTKQVKQGKGQPTDRVTLRDTGEFYDELRVKTSNGRSEVYNINWKAQQLEEKYNDGDAVIYGLAPKYMEQLRVYLFKDFDSFTKNYFRT